MSLAQAVYDRAPPFLQSQMITQAGKRLLGRRFGATYQEARALLVRSERGDRAQLVEIQNELLRTLVKRAATEVPYYREVFRDRGLDPRDIRTATDLRQLPILTKEIVRERREDLISEVYPRKKLIYAHTSGTTGAGLKLWWDDNVDAWTNAVLWRQRDWAGVPFGTRYGTIFGRVIHAPSKDRPPFWRHNRAWNQIFLSTFHLAERNLDSNLDAMRRFEIQALEAYPSAAYVLARRLRDLKQTLPLRAVFVTSEPALDFQRELIAERFACPVFDYFGAAERSVFAAECEQHQGMHVFDEFGVSEILDDGDNPVEKGEPGRLVTTSLHNFAMPFIRYEIGDVFAFRKEACACGRPLPLVEALNTRSGDVITLPDGRNLPPAALTHAFKPLECIAGSQIVQEELRRVVVSVVPRADYGPDAEASLLASLRQRLGPDVDIIVRTVEEIPRGPRGKQRWVISRVANDENQLCSP